ncbi:Predicted dehydrogenase [Verrucomicrobium sp. GAS474]|uniref:Gfo/Idh/MocA family protein n=1 Tax=Verrucomicrobium sp. GAS474 TaxID=1882831 RepID=UPI00087C4FC0|nr:Gfo/Idh/MocA family oxidoreductase [Verrucomicrobium sp. GAS474]SDU20213.1 Predicted dehydrogenase [Verrucomicrobium sp. GAS474]
MKIRMGMVGGGQGAFIGAVHRMAANLDGQIELVAGAFSSDSARSKASGKELFLPEDRCYGSYAEMFAAEAKLPAEKRIEFVAIVTPNFLHFPIAKAALESGFHVLSDKPATLDLAEAKELARIVEKTGLLYGLTHNYTGYPLVKEARDLVRSGKLGAIRKVVVEYPQGWLAQRLEDSGQKQADWRTDPKRAGISCCVGDIGTHAENLAEYVTGLRIESLCADLSTFVEGRALDDDANVLLRFEEKNGVRAKGLLHCSQISIGEENGLNIRVYGTKGSLAWRQEEPNTLVLRRPDQPRALVRAGDGCLGAAAKAATRLPMGHPEAFLEAFANLYRNFAALVRARKEGTTPSEHALDVPGIADAVRGMAFIETVVASSRSADKWVSLPR